MRLARNLKLSRNALLAHPVRSLLAIAGAAVGVCGVLVLTAIAEGARLQVVRRIESLGRNMLTVSAARVQPRAVRDFKGEAWAQSLRIDDAVAILRGSDAVMRVAPAQERGLIAKYGAFTSPVTVLGTTPDWRAIRQFDLVSGRFFTNQENTTRARVAVLGADARASLFPDSANPIGETIRIGRIPFEVVGVLASKGMSIDGNATEDDRIIIPLETALHRVFNVDYLKMIFLQARSGLEYTLEGEARAILQARHDIGADADFLIQNQRALLEAELTAQRSFRRLTIGLGFLSLIVGAVGILSIMLLAVRERRSEIGLRVAVGARRRDVVTQFLAEALLLSSAGGMAGIAAGAGITRVVSELTRWETFISSRTLVISVAAALAAGLLAGVLPAWRAAALHPIDALQAD